MKKLSQFLFGTFIALFALIFTQLSEANTLTNDPFIRQNIDKKTFEPGGQNHLFGSARGSVSERQGEIVVQTINSFNAGDLVIENAVIAGEYRYKTKFSNHGHEVHSPFDNHSSRSKSEQKGQVLADFSSYQISWQGEQVHPKDAYDGEQGGGYPAPTGARDEYHYTVQGTALGVYVRPSDSRTTEQRLADRKNARDNAQSAMTDAFEQGLTHNPNLNQWGNASETVSALAKGVGAGSNAVFESLGMSDVADGVATVRDIATLESLRALPHEQKLQAVNGIQTAQNLSQNWQSQYGQWTAQNPNMAAAAGAVVSTAEVAVKGNASKITGPKGGGAIDTGMIDGKTKQPIYQRDSGGYYITVNGKQQSVNSPYPHGNTLNNQPAESYCLNCRTTGEVVKYGETTQGEDKFGKGKQRRYSRGELDVMNAEYQKLNSGTKQEMHQDQTNNIREYTKKYGKRPKYNKTDY